VSRVSVTLPDGSAVVAQLASSAVDHLAVGDRVRVDVAPTPVLVVAD
jgi:putative spermidine/putrescine transport system ATP-binding protein